MANSPQNEMERHVFEEMGYEQLPTGRWYLPDRRPTPLPERVKKYPYTQFCRACRSRFGSKKYYDAFCGSCRNTMAGTQKQLEFILNAHSNGGDVQDLLGKITGILGCPCCLWEGNEGRLQPMTIEGIREYLPGWIVAAHCHWMHHIFWNRFPRSLRFARKEHWDRQQESERAMQFVKEYVKKHPPVIEVVCIAQVEVPIEQSGGITTVEVPLNSARAY